MLSEVEAMFGLTLFERSTRGSEPTAGGQSSRGAVKALPLAIDIDLPPIGMMTMRGQPLTTTAAQLMECLRQSAAHGSAGRAAKLVPTKNSRT